MKEKFEKHLRKEKNHKKYFALHHKVFINRRDKLDNRESEKNRKREREREKIFLLNSE